MVVTVKVAVVAFAGTVTLVGACATASLVLERAITAPPAGATLVIVTVPVVGVPPMTGAGLSVTVLRTPDNTVRLAPWVKP